MGSLMIRLLCFLFMTAFSFSLQGADFSISTFEVDVTPPLGHPTIAGLCGPAKEIKDPLWIKGLVLQGTEQPVVVASVDWCEIRNKSYDLWRDRLAAAAGTTRKHVMLTSVHQHDAPCLIMKPRKCSPALAMRVRCSTCNFRKIACSRLRRQ
ncbi:MAG: hypothetical protein R3C11_06380 [Planctomycetaceae bacterium]